MSKYNLIRNASFKSVTSAGAGNVSLSWAQLESLMDGNLISSGVTLINSDALCLEVNLGQRIQVDGVRLYASDLTKSANIRFYYKDAPLDDYTLLTTNAGSYYYTTIPDPSAPHYIRATISGVNIDIREFQIFNDDYIVAFGTDGQLYAEYLEDSLVGEEGPAQAIPIYNNGSSSVSADAYVCVDYTATSGDRYVEISNNIAGPYYILEDGVLIENNNENNIYTWDMGEYTNTLCQDNTSVVLDGLGTLIGTLPLDIPTTSLNTGSNTWDFDRVNKKMYMMGKDSDLLKLWEYHYLDNTWGYVGELAQTKTIVNNVAVMAYCAVSGTNRIYAFYDLNAGFGYYDIDGPQDNWTDCNTPSWVTSMGSYDRVSMCSDGVRYIYALASYYATNDSHNDFKRFDTISGSWSDLDASYWQNDYATGGGSNYSNNTCMTYDYDRDFIYLSQACESYASRYGNYLQRYIVSANMWTNTWFYVQSVFNTMHAEQSISYCNGWLYVSCNRTFTTGYFFRYNVSTAEVEKLYLGYYHYNNNQGGAGVYMIAIDAGIKSNPSVYFAQLYDNRDKFAGYNFAYDLSGSYTSPIFVMDDPENSSYFVIDGTTSSGYGSISYDEDSYNGTIQYRGSNIAPLIPQIVYIYAPNNIDRWTPYTDEVDSSFIAGGVSYRIIYIASDFRTGNIAYSQRYYSSSLGYFYIYDKDGNQLYNKFATAIYNFNKRLEFDNSGGVWGYGNYDSPVTFRHYNFNLETALANIDDYSYDFVYDFAVEYDGDGVWYTNKIDNVLIHADAAGTTLQQIVLSEPRALCTALDGGCWVTDNYNYNIYKYNFSGVLLETLNFGEEITEMAHDFNDGFWYISNGWVYHVREHDHVRDVSIHLSGAEFLTPAINGCWVQSYTMLWVKFIEYDSKSVIYSYTISSPSYSYDRSRVAVLSLDIDKYNEFKWPVNEIIPASYDTVWGDSGSLSWQEIPKDGYFLPKRKYHQVKVTLRTDSPYASPSVNKIIMAPSVNISDIPKNDYKNVYLKTNLPDGVEGSTYTTRLKAWWGTDE